MSENPVPLEKQLLQIDLRKGLNERERPETADPNSVLTRVENLIQNQSGAWVKRPGTPYLGGVTVDEAGTALADPKKLFRLAKGLGLTANLGRFYQFQEASSKFRDRGKLPDFVIKGVDITASSGAQASPTVHYTATCDKFHATIFSSGSSALGDTEFLSLFDRNAGAVVAKYNIGILMGGVAGDAATRCTFVANRYLHVYSNTGGAGGGLRGWVIDTSLALPATEAAITVTVLHANVGGVTIRDIAARSTDRSYILYTLAGGGTTHILAMSNTATIQDGPETIAGVLKISNSGTKLWFMTATNLGARSLATLATVAVASAAHGSAAVGTMNADSADYVYMTSESTVTFGTGGNLVAIVVSRSTAPDSTTMAASHMTVNGWETVSEPFNMTGTGRTFIHISKGQAATVNSDRITPHAVIDITTGSQSTNTQGALSYTSANVACNLEPNLGSFTTLNVKFRYLPTDASSVFPVVPIATAARGYAFGIYTLKSLFHADVDTVVFGGQSYLSGGCHSVYAGDKLSECGFIDSPLLNTEDGAAGTPNGSYKYIAVYRYVDDTGALTWSKTSVVSSKTVVSLRIILTACPPNVTNRNGDGGTASTPVVNSVEFYRTISGGTQYYLVASSQSGTPVSGLATQAAVIDASGFAVVTDNLSDATVATQPLLFRQPGTPNSPIDRYPPPAGNIICQHKDRIFTTDPQGARVYYSSFFVDGETAWYNPGFSFFVHGGSGPITALVSMDGRLFVFKRDGIFVVDGDGPSEAGPTGNEFSPPQRLATEYGCVDHRTIVVTTEGITYRSPRGIEILTRSLQVKWMGERVFQTVDANPKDCGAVLDDSGRVHFAVAASDTGTATQASTLGTELIYDFPSDSWSTHYYTDKAGVANRCFQDMVKADLYGLGEVVCYADPSGAVCYADASTGLDRETSYTGVVIETAWIKVAQQNRQRFSKVQFLAKKLASANHAVRISVAYNYVDSYTQVLQWEPGLINPLAIEELELDIVTPEVLAIRLLIEELEPANTSLYPVGTGLGCDVLGIMSEVAPKRGAPKLSTGAKGVPVAAPPSSLTGQLGTALSYLGNILLGDE